MSKRLLSLHRYAPGVEAKEALDAILVAGVFDQQVALLFREQGIRQLIASEVTAEMAEAVRSLPDYGVEGVYVCQNALEAAQVALDNLLISARALSSVEQAELLAAQDMVLCD